MHMLSAVSGYRDRRRLQKTVRKLRALRREVSPAGYTLKSFDAHHCIFVHIPKCAGVSVCQSLFGNHGAGHHPIGVFQQVFEPPFFDSCFKFTFVRNPWDRLVSAYEFLQGGGFNDTDRRWARRHLSAYSDFGRFVREWVTPENVSSWIHFRPQTDFLLLPDGRTGVDFIGRFESLEADFSQVCTRLGIQGRLGRFNTRRQRTRDYRAAYDTHTRDIVGEVYARDIAALGYRFEDGDNAPPMSQEHGEQHHAQQ